MRRRPRSTAVRPAPGRGTAAPGTAGGGSAARTFARASNAHRPHVAKRRWPASRLRAVRLATLCRSVAGSLFLQWRAGGVNPLILRRNQGVQPPARREQTLNGVPIEEIAGCIGAGPSSVRAGQRTVKPPSASRNSSSGAVPCSSSQSSSASASALLRPLSSSAPCGSSCRRTTSSTARTFRGLVRKFSQPASSAAHGPGDPPARSGS